MTRTFLIVEDHPLFAEALQIVIRGGISDVRVNHASTLGEARAAIQKEERIDLLFLDLWLPDTHGFDGLLELRRQFPKLPIVIVSAFANQNVVEKAMVCGAAGFIPKSAGKDALLQGITEVLAGEIVIPRGYCATASAASLQADRLRSLTRQQLRVLQMLCQGLLNKQIAFELDVGETTVKAHISEIFRKLSVCSRTQAVAEVSKLELGAVLALYAADNSGRSAHISQRTNLNSGGVK